MLNAGIMSEEEFNELIGGGKICVFDFSAVWCGPCRMFAPVMEELAEKYKGKYYFYQVDIDSAEELAIKYGVSAVPTVLIFKDGKEVGRTSGYQEFDEIERFINNAIK